MTKKPFTLTPAHRAALVIRSFIAERERFITAVDNCHPGNLADYYRWQGHAEARRHLAERLVTAGSPVTEDQAHGSGTRCPALSGGQHQCMKETGHGGGHFAWGVNEFEGPVGGHWSSGSPVTETTTQTDELEDLRQHVRNVEKAANERVEALLDATIAKAARCPCEGGEYSGRYCTNRSHAESVRWIGKLRAALPGVTSETEKRP